MTEPRLASLIRRFPEISVMVVGDFILDQFVFGEISRISREAPVLILRYQETQNAAGGGANAAAGVDALRARAVPVGLVGDDRWGETLLSCWPESVDSSGVRRLPGRQTTRKTRILAGSHHSFRQQVVRIDYEHPLQLSRQREEELETLMEQRIGAVHAVILSDYGLGTLTQKVRRRAIELACNRSIPVVVDSRFDPAGFSGATSATPNVTEVEEAIDARIGRGLADLEEVGNRVRADWGLQSLLITRGKLGMSLFEPDRKPVHIPIFGSDEVVDVTGAGDTVIAVYSTALAAGARFEEAARLANCAGGVVVQKRGTATVTQAELLEAVGKIDGS